MIDGYNAVFDQATGFFRAGAGIDYDQPVTCGRADRRLLGTDDQPRPGVVVLDVQAADGTVFPFHCIERVPSALWSATLRFIRSPPPRTSVMAT